MNDNDLRLLYINSSMHALVSINQTPVGQTGYSTISQPIADNTDFFITVQPLKSATGFIYIPYTRRVSISQDADVFADDGLIEICIWPDRIIELKLLPLSVYKSQPGEILPSVMAPFEFYISGERHTAFIYNEAGSSFAIEHSGTGRLKYIYPLPFGVRSADVSLAKLGEYPMLLATGKTLDNETYLFVAGILPTFRNQICMLCESFDTGLSAIDVITNEKFGQKKTSYTVQNSKLVPVSSELGWFTRDTTLPSTEEQACLNLLQTVKMNLPSRALECLSPSLAEGLEFTDLRTFFGDFESVEKTLLPSGKDYSFALKYKQKNGVYTSRVFSVETIDSHGRKLIDNITEQ